MKRGYYNEIVVSSLDDNTLQAVCDLVADAGERPDEHGSWEFGANFDRKGRGQAINWDLYAVGRDMYSGDLLAVIQIRQYRLRKKGYWPSIRKNYFLLGRNEDGTAFAHPVPAAVVHRAIQDGRDVIIAVQNWMFGGDYTRIVRQGDVGFLPVKSAPAPAIEDKEVLVAGNHCIVAAQMRRNGHLYVKDFRSLHPQHPTVEGRGWYRVIESKRARYWKFAPPTKD